MMTRLRILHRLIIAGFVFLSLILIHYQVIHFSEYQLSSRTNRIRILPQPASRGRILDRNGDILAANTLSYNLLIMPAEKGFPAEHISRLSSILPVSEEQLKAKYKKGYISAFIPILLCKDISLSQAIAIGQLKYDLPEVIIQVNPKRKYPLGNVASHILGYLGQIDVWRLEWLKEYGYKVQDLVGYCGVEEVYDHILRPREGGMQIEVDHKGRLSRVLGFKAAKKGRDIRLTIDLKLQKIVHDILQGQIGSVVMLDPANGEILALVSFPDFDPQVFQDGPSALLKHVLNAPDAPLFNRAINGLYPPGSIFKVVVAAAGLQKGKINSSSTFFCSGGTQVGNRKFSCWDKHGQEDIVGAIGDSCNVFFYNLGLRLGPQIISEYAQKFGLGQVSGIDLAGESKGFLPYSLWQRIKRRKTWYAGDTANFSIGQGEVLVTPLQAVRMIAVFANGGKLVSPRLLKSINPDSAGKQDAKKVIDSSCESIALSKQNLQIIKKGLFAAVNSAGGTAAVLADCGVSVAGKTGTAQTGSGEAHGWFTGYFPADKPKFAICVLLEHAGSGYRSCQLTKAIIERMLSEGLI